jgi:hypothetical protein
MKVVVEIARVTEGLQECAMVYRLPIFKLVF